jgi:hypothetical protein
VRRKAACHRVIGLELLITAALAAAATLEPTRTLALSPDRFPQAERTDNGVILPPATQLRFLLTEEGHFRGIGDLIVSGVPMMPPGRALGVQPLWIGTAQPAETPPSRLTAVRLTADGRGAVLNTELVAAERVVAYIDWHLRGETMDIDGTPAAGFSYAFEYRSDSHPIAGLAEAGSWCLGEGLEGLLFVDQNEGYGRSSRALVIEAGSEIKGPTPLPHKETPESRQAVGDIMDFLSATSACSVRFVSEPSLSFRRVERVAAEPGLRIGEEYPTSRQRSFRSPRVTVLLWPRGGINAWFPLRDGVTESLRQAANIQPPQPLPWLGIPSFDVAHWAADLDDRLDFYQRMGFKRLWKWSLWQTNWSEWERLSEAERQRAVKPISHSVLRLEWASRLKPDQVAALCQGANQRGMSVVLWFPTAHLSPASPLLQEHPEWIVRRRDGRVYDYVYPELAGVFHPAGYSDYAIGRLRALKQEAGFGGVFLDSAQVFGFDVIHYGKSHWPDQYGAMLDFVRTLQQEGIEVLAECLTPFALSASTGFLQDPQHDPAFLLYRTSPHWGSATAPITPERYVQLVAFMAPPLLTEDVWWQDPHLQNLGGYINQAYNRRLQSMAQCRMLPHGQGVLWQDHDRREGTLFAFTTGDIELGVPCRHAAEVLSGQTVPLIAGRVRVEAWRAYALTLR